MASVSSILKSKQCGLGQKIMLLFSRESQLVDRGEKYLRKVIIILEKNENRLYSEQLEETGRIINEYHRLTVDRDDLKAWLRLLETKDKKDTDYNILKKSARDLISTFYLETSSLMLLAERTSETASASGIGRRWGIKKGAVVSLSLNVGKKKGGSKKPPPYTDDRDATLFSSEVIHGEIEPLPPYSSEAMVKEVERLTDEGITIDNIDMSIFKDGKHHEEEMDSLTEEEQWAILSSLRIVCNDS